MAVPLGDVVRSRSYAEDGGVYPELVVIELTVDLSSIQPAQLDQKAALCVTEYCDPAAEHELPLDGVGEFGEVQFRYIEVAFTQLEFVERKRLPTLTVIE